MNVSAVPVPGKMESLHTASTWPLSEVYSDSNAHTPENSPSATHTSQYTKQEHTHTHVIRSSIGIVLMYCIENSVHYSVY